MPRKLVFTQEDEDDFVYREFKEALFALINTHMDKSKFDTIECFIRADENQIQILNLDIR